MKRLFIFIVLILLICAVHAQSPGITPNASSGNFKAAANGAFNKEINLPDWANFISQTIFGSTEKIPLSKFIILTAIWVLLFLMILNIIKFAPIFKEGALRWLGSILITLLIAISGVIVDLANGLIAFVNSFAFFKEWSAGALFFSLLFVVVVFFLIIKISTLVKNKMEIGAAQSAGEEAGQGLGLMRTISRVFSKSFKK